MLKLLIVEDEEIICETLARLTDWSSLGIELIAPVRTEWMHTI